MIKQEIFNYWNKELSVKMLANKKGYQVKYNIYLISSLVALVILFVLLLFFMFIKLNYYYFFVLLLVDFFIVWYFCSRSKRNELRWFIDKKGRYVSHEILREKELKKRIEKYYINPKKDNTIFYQELISYYQEEASPAQINYGMFFAIFTIIISIALYLFDEKREYEEVMKEKIEVIVGIIYTMIFVFLCFLIYQIKRSLDKQEYVLLRNTLRNILIKTNLKNKL